jgi:hypothetical protein
MIQLSFQPFDPFHAVFRLLRLRPIITKHVPVHVDHVRILDFYLLFPFRIEAIRLKPQHRRYKGLAVAYAWAKPYGDQPEDRTVFDRMELMQIAALETLASRMLIDPDQLILGQVTTTAEPVPDEVAKRVDIANERDGDLIEFLELLACGYERMGANGLKARTGLLEFRYDAI